MKTASFDSTAAGFNAPLTNRAARLTKDGKWQGFTKVPNLLQYVRTGTYFARIKVKGKTIGLSLKTSAFTTAKLRLADKLKELRIPKAPLG